MRNFFQKILILFTGNNYPEATQNEFYQWLVDEDHASQKEDALRELWNKAQRQKNVKGMQKSYERLKKQQGIPTVPKERRIRPIHIWQSAAAILFLLLASSVYLSTVGTKAETDLLQQYIPIAEMRSYGEGFIIADQAPDLLDESVIRNTNTKIILRLPDAQDRQIAGSSISLSEEQMKELAKLPVGVAAVYQNDWIQPVLCQVAPFSKDKVKPWNYQGENQSLSYEKVFKNIYANGAEKLDEQDLDVIDRWIDARPVSDETKGDVKRIVREKSYSDKDKKCLAYNMFQGKRIAKILWANILSHEEGKQNALAQIASIAEISNRDIIENIYRSVVEQIVESNQNDLRLIQTYTQIEGERRRVL